MDGLQELPMAAESPAVRGKRERAPRQHADLKRIVGGYQKPVLWRALLQLATSFGGFFAGLAGMYLLLPVSYWLSLALALPTSGFLVRIFIIQHDCGHASFLRSRRWMDAIGWFCSLFTLTPYTTWRRQHKGHHTIWNNLDRRQSGVDIYSTCMTVDEYKQMTPRKQWLYRLAWHPLVANLLLPPYVFIVRYRMSHELPRAWRRERRDIWITNVAAAVLYATLGWLFGWWATLAVFLPVMALGAIFGVGLFCLQHRGETIVWARRQDWDPATASFDGATYFKLSRVLQWFTGNIGFHHVHHLNHKVPNYRLQRTHEAIEKKMPAVPTLSFWSGMRALRYVLWDEGRGRLVTFREAHAPA